MEYKNSNDYINKIKHLQIKSNLLIDHLMVTREYLTESENKNKVLEEQILVLKNENKILKEQLALESKNFEKQSDVNEPGMEVSRFYILDRIINQFNKKFRDPEKQLLFKNATDISKEYIRVRKSDVDNILHDLVAGQEDEVIDFLLDLGIFRKGSRPKGLFSVKDDQINKFVSAYFIRRTAIGIADEGE